MKLRMSCIEWTSAKWIRVDVWCFICLCWTLTVRSSAVRDRHACADVSCVQCLHYAGVLIACLKFPPQRTETCGSSSTRWPCLWRKAVPSWRRRPWRTTETIPSSREFHIRYLPSYSFAALRVWKRNFLITSFCSALYGTDSFKAASNRKNNDHWCKLPQIWDKFRFSSSSKTV